MEKKLYVVHTMMNYEGEQAVSTVNLCTFDKEEAKRALEQEHDSWFESGGIFDDFDEDDEDYVDDYDFMRAECCYMNSERCAICEIDTIEFEVMVFTFSAEVYDRDDVEKMSMEECLHLANEDKTNVQKFSGGIEYLINRDVIDTENCWVRVVEARKEEEDYE